MRNAYWERFLHVDLTSGRATTTAPPPGLIELFIGGRGFAARLLWDHAPPRLDALAPASPLMFLAGPLTGTMAPCMRSLAAAKSPLTGTYLDSFFGGLLGPEIRYAGYDGIIITGRANAPAYLYIDDESVEVREAGRWWGQTTYQLYDSLHEELGGGFQWACIGPAAERGVRFALLDCSHHRQAGRGGAGAVMGAKNLKAMVVRGTRRVVVAQPARFMELTRQAYEDLLAGPGSAEFRQWGTVGGIIDDSEKGALPTYNFRQASFSGAAGIHGPQHKSRLWLRDTACLACPISCGKMGVIRRGPHRGTVAESVDYEVAATMGSNLGLEKVEDLQYAAYLCDLYGMDAMSAGVVVGFAIEAFERRLLTPADLGGLEPTFGDGRSVHRLIEMIARREDAGDLLAEGVRRAAAHLGGQAPAFAMHTKGLETPGYEPRGLPGHALGYAVADRGGCHERGYLVHYEIRGALYDGRPVDRFSRKGKAEILIHAQNHTAGNDTLIACHFAGEAGAHYAELLSAATGREQGPGDLDLAGERVWNMTRLFNLREGFTRADDELPIRVREEGLPDPPVRGQRIPQADLDAMLDEYYALRGWDQAGVPAPAKLLDLGLDVDLSAIPGRAAGKTKSNP